MPPDCPHSSCAFSLCPGLGSSNSRAQCSAGVALQAVRVRHIYSLMLGLMGCVVTLGGNSLKSSLCVYAKALFSAGSSFPGPLCCCSLALAHCSVVLCCLVLSPEMSPLPIAQPAQCQVLFGCLHSVLFLAPSSRRIVLSLGILFWLSVHSKDAFAL